MGKFDGILLGTDLDGTLLNNECKVSDENIKAIEYFKKEGGLFTFVSGRVPSGARIVLDYVRPNIPAVTFNGGGIYDFEADKLIGGDWLDRGAADVVKYADSKTEDLGLIICTDEDIIFSKMNKWVHEYILEENSPPIEKPYYEIQKPWKKVMFVVSDEIMPEFKKMIAESEFFDKYDFMQSDPHYYEILPKGTNKGSGLGKLTELVGIDKRKVIAIGDNENDISMIKTAAVGIAVGNACEELKAVADMVTVRNTESAIATVINSVEKGEITLPKSC